jgi:hypothetical protein
LNTQRLSIKLYDAYEVEGTIHTCLVCVNLFFSHVLVFQTKPPKKKTPSYVKLILKDEIWWNEILDEMKTYWMKRDMCNWKQKVTRERIVDGFFCFFVSMSVCDCLMQVWCGRNLWCAL